jgi:putative Holliday junction resolvase
MRWLGIDYGEARIGLAISDVLGSFAVPVKTLQRGPSTIQEICRAIEGQAITGIVIGLPINMDGSHGPAAVKAKAFGAQLQNAIPHIVIRFWDERLTTVEAQKMLHSAGKNAKQSRKMIDQVAAQILLQNFLDAQEIGRGN